MFGLSSYSNIGTEGVELGQMVISKSLSQLDRTPIGCWLQRDFCGFKRARRQWSSVFPLQGNGVFLVDWFPGAAVVPPLPQAVTFRPVGAFQLVYGSEFRVEGLEFGTRRTRPSGGAPRTPRYLQLMVGGSVGMREARGTAGPAGMVGLQNTLKREHQTVALPRAARWGQRPLPCFSRCLGFLPCLTLQA